MNKSPATGAHSTGNAEKDAGSASSTKSATKSARARETVASVKAQVDGLAKRLSNADHLTQKSINALETAFMILEKRVKEDSTVNKAALTRRIDQLSDKLTDLIRDTQIAVAEDIKSALDNPSEGGMERAIAKANDRVTQAEMAQADALTKVNHHIAAMAKAVDARIRKEAAERETAIANVRLDIETRDAKIAARVETVETSSAEAIRKLGENMVGLTQDFRNRAETNEARVRSTLSDMTAQTKKDIDDTRVKLERRIEGLEDNQRNLDSYTDRTLSNITARLESLEYGLSGLVSESDPLARTPDPSDDPVREPDPTPPVASPSTITSKLNVPTAVPTSPVDPTPHFAPGVPPVNLPMNDIPTSDIPTRDPSPSAHLSVVSTEDDFSVYPDTPGSGSVESYGFGSQHHNSGGSPYAPTSNGANALDIHTLNDSWPPADVQSQAYDAHADTYDGIAQPYIASEEGQAGLVGDLPYADPAYAEAAIETPFKRPGSTTKDRKSPNFSKPSILTGRNLKVAGLAVAVMSVGYFGLRGLTGSLADTNQNNPIGDFIANDLSVSNGSGLDLVDTPSVTVTDAVGEYPDNTAPVIDVSTNEGQTLEEAANTGNAIAQFQLGLAYLQSDRLDDAVKLIRKSANQGQPAAQYRLAKLYETGEGVTADPVLARQLTERAARNGNRIAMHDLALYYAEGRGDVDVQIETAADWFEKAAERGVVDSQFNLGILYESGQGLPKNLSNALMWYSIAAKQGDQDARERVQVLEGQMGDSERAKVDARIAAFVPLKINERANGIFRGMPWQVPTGSAALQPVEQVIAAQRILGELGFDIGTPDGAVGPKTRSAIISFQREQGLPETGQVDNTLVSQLQRAAGA